MIKRIMLLVGVSLTLPTMAQAHDFVVLGAQADASVCFREAASDVPRPDALQYCDRALQDENIADGDRLATFVNRGVVNYKAKRFDQAMADFNHVLAIDPDQPDALINKGLVVLSTGGSASEALYLLNAGLAGGPRMPWVGYYGRAFAHEVAHRDALAYRDYKQAQALQPGWKLPEQALARFSVR